ncbi:MAG: hypothetical protein M0Z75_12075, partial [Nitrospiraceae bacterium]|nr:hypothetical protein [Nitrospiraceae bacterium]
MYGSCAYGVAAYGDAIAILGPAINDGTALADTLLVSAAVPLTDRLAVSDSFGITAAIPDAEAIGLADSLSIVKWGQELSVVRDSSRLEPVYLVQITLRNGGPTLYLSDRNITVGNQRYESYLH